MAKNKNCEQISCLVGEVRNGDVTAMIEVGLKIGLRRAVKKSRIVSILDMKGVVRDFVKRQEW